MKNEEKNRYIRFAMGIEYMAKTLQKCRNKKLEPFGLHSMHLMFLFVLYNSRSGMTCTELAESCSVDKAFISRVGSELREKGYVDCVGEKEGGNKRQMTLSPLGLNIMEQINSIINATISKATEGISQDELAVFYSVLNRIGENLELATESQA